MFLESFLSLQNHSNSKQTLQILVEIVQIPLNSLRIYLHSSKYFPIPTFSLQPQPDLCKIQQNFPIIAFYCFSFTRHFIACHKSYINSPVIKRHFNGSRRTIWEYFSLMVVAGNLINYHHLAFSPLSKGILFLCLLFYLKLKLKFMKLFSFRSAFRFILTSFRCKTSTRPTRDDDFCR